MSTKGNVGWIYFLSWLGLTVTASPALAQLQVTFAVGTAVEQIVDNDGDDRLGLIGIEKSLGPGADRSLEKSEWDENEG